MELILGKLWEPYPKISRLRDTETIQKTKTEDMESWLLRVSEQHGYAGYHTLTNEQSDALYAIRNS